MLYLDASALVKRYVAEMGSPEVGEAIAAPGRFAEVVRGDVKWRLTSVNESWKAEAPSIPKQDLAIGSSDNLAIVGGCPMHQPNTSLANQASS